MDFPTIALESALPRNFYDEQSQLVAPRLLWKYLIRRIEEGFLVWKIVETEAYMSSGDMAAHNYIGKTPRNQILYNEAGYAYVHAMRHHCLIDIVTEEEDVPGSVLIRAIEPVYGIEKMKAFRSMNESSITNITNGPAKLCQALNITLEHNGVDVTNTESPLFVSEIEPDLPSQSISCTTRIGISKSAELELRFFITDNPFISKMRRNS